MKHIENSNENQAKLKLGDTLSIYEVTAIHKELLQSLLESESLIIDLSDVISCDIAGLQLLLATNKTGEIEGKEITISKVSEAVLETARLLGVQQDILNVIDGGYNAKDNHVSR